MNLLIKIFQKIKTTYNLIPSTVMKIMTISLLSRVNNNMTKMLLTTIIQIFLRSKKCKEKIYDYESILFYKCFEIFLVKNKVIFNHCFFLPFLLIYSAPSLICSSTIAFNVNFISFLQAIVQ
jgi:hypothetical protein